MKITRYGNLFEQIEFNQPKTILEVGTWNGNHAVQMINKAAMYQPKDDIVYYGFDLWEDLNDIQVIAEGLSPKPKGRYIEAYNRIRQTGIEFHLIKGNTQHTLKDFKPEFPIDFIFIDGGHSLETIASDWRNVQRLMHGNTTVLFDDYYPQTVDKGCKTLIDCLLEKNIYEVTFLEPIDETTNGLKNQMVKVCFAVQI